MRQIAHNYSTESLGAEHQSVLQYLDKLEKHSQQWGSGGASDAEAKAGLEEVLTFFDQELELHLKKEEVALFPAMEAVIGTDGPTHVMLIEHEELRKNLAQLKTLVPTLSEPDGVLSKQLKKTGDYVCRLLREHIEKEDAVLFPMADQIVPPAEMAKVDQKVRELDAGR
ncbi:MAG: hemerythrin domain-containing protein [Chloroflexota bacterium]|nr:MAG: hemerythrin domain-containing protein [Chloroflexota bacterium]